jgi:hypothetical protein
MGIFFNQHGVKEDEPQKKQGPTGEAQVGNYRLGIDHMDGALIVDGACLDGTNLFKEVPDNMSIPIGQLYLVHPMGLIDYNGLIDQAVAPRPSSGGEENVKQ